MPDANKNGVSSEKMDDLLNQAFLEMDPKDPRSEDLLERVSKSVMLAPNISEPRKNKKFFKSSGFWLSIGILAILAIAGIPGLMNTEETKTEEAIPTSILHSQPINNGETPETMNLENSQSGKKQIPVSGAKTNPNPTSEEITAMPATEDSTQNSLAIHPSSQASNSDTVATTKQDSSATSLKNKTKHNVTDTKRKKKKGKGKWVEREIKIYPN